MDDPKKWPGPRMETSPRSFNSPVAVRSDLPLRYMRLVPSDASPQQSGEVKATVNVSAFGALRGQLSFPACTVLFAPVALWILGILLTSLLRAIVRQENPVSFLSIQSQELDWVPCESSL